MKAPVSLKPDMPGFSKEKTEVAIDLTQDLAPFPVPKEPIRLKDTDANYTWTVISVPNCKYADAAVALLESRGETVQIQTITSRWQRRLQHEFNTKRIPAIFRGNQYFGSYGELETYFKASFYSEMETFP